MDSSGLQQDRGRVQTLNDSPPASPSKTLAGRHSDHFPYSETKESDALIFYLMPYSPEASPLSEEEIRDMEKAGELMMEGNERKPLREASKNHEQRIIELGKDGHLEWQGFQLDKDITRYPESFWDVEQIWGKVKDHSVEVEKRAKTHVEEARGALLLELDGFDFRGSVDHHTPLSAQEAEELFKKYQNSGLLDVDAERLEREARQSVDRESKDFAEE